jgi:hypothetical protein
MKHTIKKRIVLGLVVPVVSLLVLLFAFGGGALAQARGPVQALDGTLGPGEFLNYRLPDLREGQTLYVYLAGTSGNLDPTAGLVDASADLEALEVEYLGAVQQALAEGRDPLLAAREAADALFLAWVDDSGEGLAAAMGFPVPADGDYRLLVSGALSALGHSTFGDYRLLVGLDAPEVLSGEASPTGETKALLDRETLPPGEAVQEVAGALTTERQTLEIRDLRPDDTLYLFVEATSGDLRPSLVLRNFADKPVRTANLSGTETQTNLEYTVEEDVRNYELSIKGCCQADSSGEYRLLVGVNRPDVLTGRAVPTGQPVIEEPIPVQIGIKLQQIVEADEQNERFAVVASLQMEWSDPKLAFDSQ